METVRENVLVIAMESGDMYHKFGKKRDKD
jgi:hypothetical protein